MAEGSSDVSQRYGRNFFLDGEAMLARVDHRDVVELQVADGRMGGCTRASLYLNSKPNRRPRWVSSKSSSAPSVSPEHTPPRSQRPQNHLQGKPLPGSAHARMSLQRQVVADVHERVQDPGVAEINLRRLDLPLADVLKPRRQPPYHERARSTSRYELTVLSERPMERARSEAFEH